MKSAAVLYSGGKDSTYAIELLRRGGYDVSCLVTIYSDNPDSYMLHTANINLVELSAQALQIPLHSGRTKGNKEEELQDIKHAVQEAKEKYGFEVLGCGGLASNYQKTRIEKIAEECQVASSCPLWGIDQKEYLKMLVDSNYHFILTSVSAAGLDDSWLGKEINRESVVDLIELSKKYSFNAALEGGEGETLVLDCPLFVKKRLMLLEFRKKWDGYQGTLEITKAELETK
jgi:ABC transporter with metal-binding/Fe-S-binding domain ATP-binding protein